MLTFTKFDLQNSTSMMSTLYCNIDCITRLPFNFGSYLVFLFLISTTHCQNLDFHFPFFNDSSLTCSGTPQIIGNDYCSFNSTLSILTSDYSTLYPTQAARAMYGDPITFSDGKNLASFNTFFIFSVSHTEAHPAPAELGDGFAFIIAPTPKTTPDNSTGAGLGLFPYDPGTGSSTLGSNSKIVAIEFDTLSSPPFDMSYVPHVGVDVNSLASSNASSLYGAFFLIETVVGMWINYHADRSLLEVFVSPLNSTDGSATRYKPATPVLTHPNFPLANFVRNRSYVGFSASSEDDYWESNEIFFWSFQVYGFPDETFDLSWYSLLWKYLTSKLKGGVVAGAVVGSLVGCFCLSACIFSCFFNRNKKPHTPAQKSCPILCRSCFLGFRNKPIGQVVPPINKKKKKRDSLSTTKPLNLWGSPTEPAHIDPTVQKTTKDQLGKITEHDSKTSVGKDTHLPKEGTKTKQGIIDNPLFQVEQTPTMAQTSRQGQSMFARQTPTQVTQQTLLQGQLEPNSERRPSGITRQRFPPKSIRPVGMTRQGPIVENSLAETIRPPGMQRGQEPPPGMQRGLEAPPEMQRGLEPPPGMQRGLEAPLGMQRGLEAPPEMQRGLEPPPGMQRGLEPPGQSYNPNMIRPLGKRNGG